VKTLTVAILSAAMWTVPVGASAQVLPSWLAQVDAQRDSLTFTPRGLTLDGMVIDHGGHVIVTGSAGRVEFEPDLINDTHYLTIKYGASGGWIGISARASGREVQITVADKGMGIEAAEQANIFDPFYRTPDVIAAQIQGAGLGLSLVQRIVEAHGGQVSVKSAPGQGSEFTVQLPAADAEPAGDRVDVPAASGSQPLAGAQS
jgi:hypothetical protein